MNPDFQRRIQRYGWDKAVPYYESAWQRALRPAQQRLVEVADVKTGERVLDVAAGTGLVTRPVAEQVGENGRVLAVDLSNQMVETLRAIIQRNGHGQVDAQQMDAENLDVPDEAFDVVLCSLGLMYVPEPRKAIQEMHRVLVPGGRAVALVWGRRAGCGWADLFPIMDKRVKSDVCPLFFQLGTGNNLETQFQSAGFEEITTDRFNMELPFENEEEACEAAFWGGAVALAWDKFDEEKRAGARREYLGSIDEYRDGEGYRIPGEFVIAQGCKATT